MSKDNAIRRASSFLQKVFQGRSDDVNMMKCLGSIIVAEEDGDADFFLSALDGVIDLCTRLKKDILDETKNIKSVEHGS